VREFFVFVFQPNAFTYHCGGTVAEMAALGFGLGS